jgi:hypothetical protein
MAAGGKPDEYADTSFGWFGHPASEIPASDETASEGPRDQPDTDPETTSALLSEDAGIPDPVGPAAAADGRLPLLAPHRAWQPRHLPDVNSAVRWAIIEGLIDIVTGEGPVVTSRVYELYVRASGGRRVGKNIRHVLDQAVDSAIRSGLLAQVSDRAARRSDKTVYLPGTPPVILRRRGDRELEHIPPTEVAAVARHIIDRDATITDSELKRLLLNGYERVRLTGAASDFLDNCIAIARRQ